MRWCAFGRPSLREPLPQFSPHWGPCVLSPFDSTCDPIALHSRTRQAIQGKDSQIGKVIGPAVSEEVLPGVVKNITNAYLANRNDHETFHETFLRIGLEPFKLAAYGPAGA